MYAELPTQVIFPVVEHWLVQGAEGMMVVDVVPAARGTVVVV